MKFRKQSRADFAEKKIDVHSHAGISLKAYALGEYPYAATIEGLWALQKNACIDVNVVFPFTADLYFDPAALARGECLPSSSPLSPVPYGSENALLLKEVFDYCPELSDRFLPFVSIDPVRKPVDQIRRIEELADRYPIYGIKINPVLCQSKVSGLLGEGKALMEFIRSRGWPVLFHSALRDEEAFSNIRMTLEVMENNPGIRYCVAHCAGFHRELLDRLHAMQNVWVDSSALKIQVRLVRDENPWIASPKERVEADYADHCKVFRTLVERYPGTFLWGSDAPAYSYICRRKQAEGVYEEFRLKATYQDEADALFALPGPLAQEVSNTNTLDFIFG